ncbi:MAG: GlsB/YeaQ/YmgE family stress response membrane protein [Pseudomonadota bacterium]
MGLIGFLIIGVLAGFIAEKVMKSNHGLIVNLIVGIIGSYVGGFLAGVLGISFGGFAGSLVIATVGAIVFLYVLGLIKGR